ncbi:sodium:proline symporter [Candidatus Marinamargulisbacteria bacterium SCGC AG-439-L15]|nr:sodium:proline symporter [Candidatus Marinamargulisbacteria bacterium SCGC AG-439-L15]
MSIKVFVLLAYLAILFLIGIVASKRVKTLSDFYVGGKKLGYWVVAFSARATGESGWLLLGLTGMGALLGAKAFWVVAGEVIGVSLCWLLMAKKFKWLTDQFNSITITDYLVGRFRSKTTTLRLLSAVVLATFITIYVSAQIDATGVAFETFFGWNYFVGALVGFGIVSAYIFFGGFVAVAWSDLFQGIMMLIGLVALPIIGFFAINTLGNETSFLTQLSTIDPALVSIWGQGGPTLMNLLGIIGFLMIGAGFLGSPQIFVRFISVKDETEIAKGTWVAIVFTILTDSAAVLAGMTGRVLLTKPGQAVESVLGSGSQNVLPLMVETLLPTVLVGVYIAIVLSAIMSTIDSLLVVASSAVTRDIYQNIYHPDKKDAELNTLSRYITLGMACLALTVAISVALLSPTRTVFWFVLFGWSGIAASFCPMIILSLSWRSFNEKGAIASMITGFLSVPLFTFLMPKIPILGPYFAQLSELPPSIFLAISAGIIVSKWYPDHKLEHYYDTLQTGFKRRSLKEAIPIQEVLITEKTKVSSSMEN